MDNQRYSLRDARDTLMDLLPVKSTFPSRNLPVTAERLVVAYDDKTNIIIHFSQPEVWYEVYDDTGKLINEKTNGNGNDLFVKTPPLTKEDYTFSIIATKVISGLQSRLFKTVTVKVGVDTGLNIILKDKIIDYNAATGLVVEKTQPNAKYQVFDMNDKSLSKEIKSGKGGDLEIAVSPLKEDTVIKVKATNIKTGLSDFMTQKPEILVRPDTQLKAGLKMPQIDYNSTATVVIEDTQATARYELQLINIDDDSVDQSGISTIKVSEVINGNGGGIEFPTIAFKEDPTIRVVVTKIKSGIRAELEQKVFVPVKPDPDKQLSLASETLSPGESTLVSVQKTQPGVMYQLQTDPDNTAIGWPRYHHKNYGIGKARVEIEFAIDRFEGDSVELPTEPLQATTAFNVLAIKATTKASVLLNNKITVTVEKK